MFAMPALLKKWKWFQKFWPYSFTEEELEGDGTGQGGFMEAEVWSIKEIAILLAISVSIVGITTKLSGYVSPGFASAVRILLISTISIAVAQIPSVRKLKGASNLGLFFGMMFLAVVGFSVDIRGFLGAAASITLFCFCVIVFSFLLHVFVTRLFKIRYEYVLLGIVGAIADGSTAALVASGAKWKSLISVGLLMGCYRRYLRQLCRNRSGLFSSCHPWHIRKQERRNDLCSGIFYLSGILYGKFYVKDNDIFVEKLDAAKGIWYPKETFTEESDDFF